MVFSVLICTYNRQKMLQQTLNSLIKMSIEKPDQVVVVNGGDSRTDAVVRSFQQHSMVEILLIKTVNKNLAASRNVGLKHCTGDIIAMTDDDAEVSPDWITQMKRIHIEYPEAGAVGGPVIGATNPESFFSRLSDLVTFPSPLETTYVRTLPGVNISYKCSVIKKLRHQDETLFRGEDVDFNWRVKKLGYQILYHPAIKVKHHHRPDLKQFLVQHHMYGRAYYLVRRKWPEMYCVYPHQLKQLKDLLKAVNFVFSIVYQPFVVAMKLERWLHKIGAIFVLLANQISWKSGMFYQRWLASTNKSYGNL